MTPDEMREELERALGTLPIPKGGWPVRKRSANGQPPPFSELTRRCYRCSACFIGLAVGKTGERGLWTERGWWCSQECFDADNGGGR